MQLSMGLPNPLDFIGDHNRRQDNARDQANNREQQERFAKEGVRWKVEDARKAGISPLAALGAQTHSFQATTGTDGWSAFNKGGADLTVPMSKGSTEHERMLAKLQLAAAEADLDGKVIENQLKASQLRKMNQGPAFPGSDNFMPGQGNSGLVNVKPKERSASQPGRPAQEAGWVPDVGYSRTDTGLTPVVPNSLSESLEDDIIGKFLWRIRNQLIPNVTGSGSPPKSQLPSGYDYWKWSLKNQEWQPAKSRGYMTTIEQFNKKGGY